uniref:(northern house mosquito) hypothetical protein n=1 Tax=Culex pipiens TaxID=7175 RepID=A0A8D8EQL6_CULPI
MRLDTSLNSSAASLLPAITESTPGNDEAVVFRSDSLPTIRVSSPPQLPAALVRSPSRVASVANPGVAGISRRLVSVRLPGLLAQTNLTLYTLFFGEMKKKSSVGVADDRAIATGDDPTQKPGRSTAAVPGKRSGTV